MNIELRERPHHGSMYRLFARPPRPRGTWAGPPRRHADPDPKTSSAAHTLHRRQRGVPFADYMTLMVSSCPRCRHCHRANRQNRRAVAGSKGWVSWCLGNGDGRRAWGSSARAHRRLWQWRCPPPQRPTAAPPLALLDSRSDLRTRRDGSAGAGSAPYQKPIAQGE